MTTADQVLYLSFDLRNQKNYMFFCGAQGDNLIASSEDATVTTTNLGSNTCSYEINV